MKTFLKIFNWLSLSSSDAVKNSIESCQTRQRHGNDTATTRQRVLTAGLSYRKIAILTLLLTLGVGQMWATVTIYAVGNMEKKGGGWVDEKTTMYCHNWGSSATTWPGQSMTKWNDVSVDGHQVWTCNLKADGNTGCIFNNNGGWQTDNITNLNATVKAYPYPTYLNGTWYYSPRVCKALWESDQHAYGGRIYFDNSSASWGDTYMYFVIGHGSYVGYYRITNIGNTKLYYVDLGSQSWGDSKYVAVVGNSSSKTTGSGNPNNLAALTHFSDAYQYSLEYESTYLVSMSSGTNCSQISMDYKSGGYSDFNSTQTINTVVKAAGGSYTSANSKATISITSYEMTGDGAVTKRTPSISTSAKTATVSAARTATTTLEVGEVATGYQFDGWYTGATSGTKLSSSTTYTYYPTSATTVYARFSEKTFTVTVTNDGHGTTSPSGAQSNKGQITGVAVSATPSDGYNFNNWTITSGTGSFADATDESTTFYPTGTATIRANFVSAATSTLSVTATTGGSITTPAAGYYSDITTTGYSIAASRSEGYKFTGWTKTAGDGAVSFANASSLSTTATITTLGDVTVTAGFAAMSNSLSVSSSSVYAGSDVTLTATKTNHTLDLKYQYKIGTGSWNTITTKSGTSHTYTIPYANTYQTYYFRVVSTDGSTDIISPTQTVEVKGRITIHVKNTNSWATMKLYSWYNDGSDHATNGAWNGTTGTGSNGQSCSIHATGSQWWDVTITQTTSNAQKFILSCSTSGNQNKTADLNLSSFTHDAYYAMSTNGSAVQTLSTTTTPAAPTLSTSAASSIAATSATLGGNVTDLGNDIISERGYYWSTNSTLSSSNLGVGTKVTVSGTQSSTGTFSNSKTGLTNGTTYYFIAYAKNGYGTSYGAVNNFRTKFITTVTLNMQGGSDGTSEVTATEGSAMPSGKTAPGKTGYTFGGYYASAGGSGKQYYTSSMGSANNWDVAASTATIHAKWTAKTYDVTLSVNGGSGANQTVTATYDAAMPTTLKGGGAIAARTRTGYNFAGYAQNADGTGTLYYTSALANNHNWDQDVVSPVIYAKWTPKQSALSFDYQTSDPGYKTSGTISAASSATYDAEMPALSGNIPTAKDGYAFIGFFDGTGDGAKKYYNADKSSAATWDKNTTSGTTLYAHYKKAEITDLTLSSAIVAPSTNFTVTPTLDPASGVQGTIVVCYKVQYSNGTDLPVQPAMSQVGNVVTITAPTASATYRIEAKLRLNDCDGTVLDTRVTTFQVAGEHTVTVRYQDSDGRTIKASTEVTARPLTWTTAGDITPPAITGYTFARWDAGDGVSIKNGDSDPVTTTTTSSIQIKAVYDGTLTAVYNKKNMIFFNNTLGWEDVWVYFYTSDNYWANNYGTGAWRGQYFNGDRPYYDMHRGHMTQIEGTNIWYFDYTAQGWDGWENVAFTNMGDQTGQGASANDQAPDDDHAYFSNTTDNPIQVVRRGDHKTTLPMFVPLTGQTKVKKNNNKAEYMSNGYWMNYPENTGYTLKIYNAWNANRETAAVQSIAFPYSEDKTMPLKMDVELSDGYNHDYWFMVYLNDGTYWGNEYHFKQGYNAEQIITNVDKKSKITTSAPGKYTFTLTYHDNGSGTVNYYIDVDYPIATGDYRIYYSDNATWSKAAHTKDSWYHPSHSIGKATTEAKKDTISFYIPKGEGILHTMKFQKASVTNEGIVSWSDVDGGSITIPSSVTTTGVYNFIVSQPAGGASISLEKVEPYTGNFYIRTDCAGNTKWDSFKNLDHQMTYSDYAANNSGFSHYFAHWVTGGNNVKFCIANDYSMCISDTLTQDYGTVVANIDANGFLASGSAHNANIRFMWNQETNKISRAYISGSSNISDRFLVLEGDAKMYDKDGNALSITGLNANEINLVDDQNFVYEQTIQVNTSARAKLTAKYNNNIQYFRGSAGAFAEGTTVELLGGSASGKHKMRIVYDFKTDRLVTAYLPSGTIDEEMEINADLMIVREHQEDGQQITFNGGSLSEVHTVYGVMRFNRWTLNNKEKTGEHDPVGDPKSAYERAIYWISFPFDVNLSDVFGFGTYGVDWIIEYYDGEGRAAKGYWADSPTFWKYVTNRNNFVLEAGKGYVLALDLDRMKDNDETFWVNNIEQIELFFPSASNTVGNIEATNVTTTVDSHACTIDRTGNNGEDINKNRTKADSHWNMIGVPSYANYGTTLTSDGSTTITWNSTPSATNSLPFLYEYNLVDNTYTVQSGTTYPFKAMHAYMVQYHGNIYWSMASATPVSPIVARRTYAETPKEVEFRLELQQNDKMVDQTFVKMSNDEEVSANFVFDEDLCKEYNGSKANVYTFIENWIPAAGNTLPMSEQTTVVPVGVKTVAAGDYTFSIPDGTSGIGVTLIDNETGVRTNLGLMDYTVTLTAGTYDQRFVLEIPAISSTPTGVEEVTGDGLPVTGARKVLIDNKLYIIKGDKVYDARGAKVQ